MAAEATLNLGATIKKLLSLSNLPGTTSIDRSLKTRIDLSASSTPDIDDAWTRRMSLSAGTLTLALDALPETGLSTLDLTGKIVYAVIIHNLGANAMTFAGAATNPYELFGGATEQVIMDPDGWLIHYSPTGFGTGSGTESDITEIGRAHV